MANTAKAITSDTKDGNVRRITGTLGADGTLVVGERMYGYSSVSIQLTGTFNSSVQTEAGGSSAIAFTIIAQKAE